MRYARDPVLNDGHYVAFQRDDARAKIVEFVRAAGAGEVPSIR